jgi:hypothetical protein
MSLDSAKVDVAASTERTVAPEAVNLVIPVIEITSLTASPWATDVV